MTWSSVCPLPSKLYEYLLVGRQQGHEVGEVGVHEIRSRQHHGIGVGGLANDRADDVHIAVAHLEGVVVADRHDGLGRVGPLPRLDQVREELGLREALGAHPRAVRGVVDPAERPQVVHDHRQRERVSRRRRDDGAQHERRPVVEQRRRVRHRVEVGRVEAHLRHVHDGDAARLDEQAHVDAADVVALHQIGRVAGIGAARGHRVGVHPRGHGLERREVLHLLDADDVGRFHHVADGERRLRQPPLERLGREHGVARAPGRWPCRRTAPC